MNVDSESLHRGKRVVCDLFDTSDISNQRAWGFHWDFITVSYFEVRPRKPLNTPSFLLLQDGFRQQEPPWGSPLPARVVAVTLWANIRFWQVSPVQCLYQAVWPFSLCASHCPHTSGQATEAVCFGLGWPPNLIFKNYSSLLLLLLF